MVVERVQRAANENNICILRNNLISLTTHVLQILATQPNTETCSKYAHRKCLKEPKQVTNMARQGIFISKAHLKTAAANLYHYLFICLFFSVNISSKCYVYIVMFLTSLIKTQFKKKKKTAAADQSPVQSKKVK